MHIQSLSNITEYCIAFYFSVNINFKFQVAFSISFRGILCTQKLIMNAINFPEIVFATSSAVYINVICPNPYYQLMQIYRYGTWMVKMKEYGERNVYQHNILDLYNILIWIFLAWNNFKTQMDVVWMILINLYAKIEWMLLIWILSASHSC